MTAQTALIGDYFEGAARSTLMGWQICARNFGGFLCISLAGWVAQSSPRWPFAIYGLALAFLPVMHRVVAEPARPIRDGTGTAVPAGVDASWRRPFLALALLQALTNMLFFLVPTQMPFLFDARGFDSAATTGAALGVLMLAGGGAALLYARLRSAIGYAGVFAFGYAAMAGGFTCLALSPSLAPALVGAALIGAGYAAVSPTFVALALHLAPLARRGLAGGVLTASVFLGQFASPLISTPFIAHAGYDGLFGTAAAVLGLMALIAFVLARPAGAQGG